MPTLRQPGKPYLQDPDLTIWNGDVREVLRELPDESVQMCVTSPPYWGLRDYGTEGQIGLEPTPEAYVATMVEVFCEVRRVLRKDGTLWLNLGDSYASGEVGRVDPPNKNLGLAATQKTRAERRIQQCTGLKPKDLCMIPARVALALQADGWYLRSEITWCKPNPMPESVTDRPTQATEKVYLFSKSARYFYDAEAVREPYKYDGRKVTRVEGRDGSHQHRSGERWPGIGKAHHAARAELSSHGHDESEPMDINHGGRNLRNWWEIATEPYPEAHFATYPTELVRRCILAGTSERGCCPECGAPWVREIEVSYEKGYRSGHLGRGRSDAKNSTPADMSAYPALDKKVKTTGWRPTCEHDAGNRNEDNRRNGGEDARLTAARNGSLGPTTVPCVVLDPFGGSGTTAYVARKLGRRSILIELSADYCALAAKRTQQLSLEAVA